MREREIEREKEGGRETDIYIESFQQSWEFPDEETGLPGLPWSLNFGFGAKVQMDKGGHLLPQMRMKAKHFAFYILPLPLFELRGKWPIGGTRLAIDIRYR